jgi:hypothetical protein
VLKEVVVGISISNKRERQIDDVQLFVYLLINFTFNAPSQKDRRMQMLKMVLGILLSASLMACGTSIVSEACTRTQECQEAEFGVEFAAGSNAACVNQFNTYTAGYSSEELDAIDTALQACLAEPTCDGYDICIEILL